MLNEILSIQNELKKMKDEIAILNQRLNDQQQEIQKYAEPRAVLFSVLSKDHENYKIKIGKDETIGLPFINMKPNENSICTLEYSPNGSKITILKEGTYQMNFSLSILGPNKTATSIPIQFHASINNGPWLNQFCSVPQTRADWLSYSTGSDIRHFYKNDHIVLYLRALEQVELWGTTESYSTFSLIYLN